MIRRVAAIVVALCVNTVPLHGQNPTFKVTTDSAEVHKAPTTASPVIGHAARGSSFEITRELGSWVKIAWPNAADGVGYLHVTTGAVAHGRSDSARPAAGPAPRSAAAPANAIPPAAPRRAVRADDSASTHAAPGYVRPPAHMFGVGGRVGGPDLNVGATARAWASNRFGLQVDLSRGANDAPARVTSLQFAPSLIYAFRDRVSDYWWLRPYVGAGPTFQRNSLDAGLRDPIDPASDTRFGVQGFGGIEMTFASMPKLAVSADFGVRAQQSSTFAVDDSGPRFVMSVHWYLK